MAAGNKFFWHLYFFICCAMLTENNREVSVMSRVLRVAEYRYFSFIYFGKAYFDLAQTRDCA